MSKSKSMQVALYKTFENQNGFRFCNVILFSSFNCCAQRALSLILSPFNFQKVVILKDYLSSSSYCQPSQNDAVRYKFHRVTSHRCLVWCFRSVRLPLVDIFEPFLNPTKIDPSLVKMFLCLFCVTIAAHFIQGRRNDYTHFARDN